MVQKRVIVCLDVRNGKVTKGIKFKNNADIGDPVELAVHYYQTGADELVFYDITASVEQRKIMLNVVRDVASNIFIPFSVGGGISSLDDMYTLLSAGAEKVSVNSAAVLNPGIIDEGAKKFGNQCIVLGLDVLADSRMPSGYRVVTHGGRKHTEKDVLKWVQEAVERGVGEIVANSIDADGTRGGYDCVLTEMLSSKVSVPVVASGGAGEPIHVVEVFRRGKADAALVASMVHYGDYTIAQIKNTMKHEGLLVRIM